jgi:hypothetical protein
MEIISLAFFKIQFGAGAGSVRSGRQLEDHRKGHHITGTQRNVLSPNRWTGKRIGFVDVAAFSEDNSLLAPSPGEVLKNLEPDFGSHPRFFAVPPFIIGAHEVKPEVKEMRFDAIDASCGRHPGMVENGVHPFGIFIPGRSSLSSLI